MVNVKLSLIVNIACVKDKRGGYDFLKRDPPGRGRSVAGRMGDTAG